MSSHRFLFVRDHEDFFNWSACIIALNLIKEILCEYMEEIADKYIRGLPTDDKNHVVDFIEHNRRYYPNNSGKAYMMEKLKCPCMSCKSLYKRIQDDLLGSPENSVLLEPLGNVRSINPGWNLLKMNLDRTGKNTQHIQDCDLKHLCRIVQRCRLFEPPKYIEKVIANRNALIHSSSNEVSTEEKRSYLSDLEELLESPGLYNRPKVRDAKDKITSMKSNNSRFQSIYEDCDELKKSIESQMKAVENDIRELNSKNLQVPTLQKIMSIIKENKRIVEDRKRMAERKEATLAQAVVMGSADGAMTLSAGGRIGESIGSITGGAGAYVAGQYKKRTQ